MVDNQTCCWIIVNSVKVPEIVGGKKWVRVTVRIRIQILIRIGIRVRATGQWSSTGLRSGIGLGLGLVEEKLTGYCRDKA